MRLLEEEDYLEQDSLQPPTLKRSGSFVRVSPSLKRSGSLICITPLIDSLSRPSLSYDKLPQEPLRLTVLKLDGSSFEIEVAKDGRVAELKEAVEASFKHLPKKVSWPHVWGHFCLFYDGQKLLSDNDEIGCYGIKDGDQLQFTRHVSINYNLRRALSESDLHDSSISNENEGGGQQLGVENNFLQDVENRKGSNEYRDQNIENHKRGDDDDDFDDTSDDDEDLEDNGVAMNCQYKLAILFRRWFSYRKLSSSEPSAVGSFKNFVRPSSQRETWKAK